MTTAAAAPACETCPTKASSACFTCTAKLEAGTAAMTPMDARISLCETLATKLEADAAAAEKDLEARFNTPGFVPNPESNNIAVTTLAALELAALLRTIAEKGKHERDKAARPRILRPERSLKIARPR